MSKRNTGTKVMLPWVCVMNKSVTPRRINTHAKMGRTENEARELLNNLTGITWQRNWAQASKPDQADLLPDHPRCPIVVEVKAYKDGGLRQAWLDQVVKAANAAGKLGCVFYKINRKPWQAAMQTGDFIQLIWGRTDEFNDLTDPVILTPATVGQLVRERINADQSICSVCEGTGTMIKVMNDPLGYPAEIDMTVDCDFCNGLGHA